MQTLFTISLIFAGSFYLNAMGAPLTGGEISKARETCLQKDPTNRGVIICNDLALRDADQALQTTTEKLISLNQGFDAHGRDLRQIVKSITLAARLFPKYIKSECFIEVYTGGGGTASDTKAAFSSCEIRLKVERLVSIERLNL